MSLVPEDVGRSISFVDGFFGVDTRSKITQVIESLVTLEEEVLCRNERWYTLRIAPYKTLDHSIRGALVSLVDIDIRKRTAALMRDVGEYAGKFLGAIHHPLLMVDGKFRIVWANEAYYHRFQMTPEETIGNVFPNPNDSTWAGTRVREKLEDTLRKGEVMRDFTVRSDQEKMIRLGASKVPVASDSTLLLVSIEEG